MPSFLSGPLGTVYFSVVEGEDTEYTNNITDRPVEDGTNTSDNSNPNPVIKTISGIVVGVDANEKFELLKQYRDNSELLQYVGRKTLPRCIIQSFTPREDNTIANGFLFSMVLKQIRIVNTETFEFDASKVIRPKIQTESKAGKQSKKTVTVNQGDFDAITKIINSRLGGQTPIDSQAERALEG